MDSTRQHLGMVGMLAASVLVMASCGDAADDTGDALCGSTQGFVYGTVLLSDGTAATDATVTAVDVDPGDLGSVDADLGGNGSYELNLEGNHTWEITAQAAGCSSEPITIPVAACTEYERDLQIAPCR